MLSLKRMAATVAITVAAAVPLAGTPNAAAADKNELKIGFAVAQTGPSSSNALDLLRATRCGATRSMLTAACSSKSTTKSCRSLSSSTTTRAILRGDKTLRAIDRRRQCRFIAVALG